MDAAAKRELAHKSYYRQLAKAKKLSQLSFDQKLANLKSLLQDYGHASGLSSVLRRGRRLPSVSSLDANFYTSEPFLGLRDLAEELQAQKARLRSDARKTDFAQFEAAAIPLAKDLTETLLSDAKLKTVVLRLHQRVGEQRKNSHVRAREIELEDFALVGEITDLLGARKVTTKALSSYRVAANDFIAKLQELGAQVSLGEAEDELEVALILVQSEVL